MAKQERREKYFCRLPKNQATSRLRQRKLTHGNMTIHHVYAQTVPSPRPRRSPPPASPALSPASAGGRGEAPRAEGAPRTRPAGLWRWGTPPPTPAPPRPGPHRWGRRCRGRGAGSAAAPAPGRWAGRDAASRRAAAAGAARRSRAARRGAGAAPPPWAAWPGAPRRRAASPRRPPPTAAAARVARDTAAAWRTAAASSPFSRRRPAHVTRRPERGTMGDVVRGPAAGEDGARGPLRRRGHLAPASLPAGEPAESRLAGNISGTRGLPTYHSPALSLWHHTRPMTRSPRRTLVLRHTSRRDPLPENGFAVRWWPASSSPSCPGVQASNTPRLIPDRDTAALPCKEGGTIWNTPPERKEAVPGKQLWKSKDGQAVSSQHDLEQEVVLRKGHITSPASHRGIAFTEGFTPATGLAVFLLHPHSLTSHPQTTRRLLNTELKTPPPQHKNPTNETQKGFLSHKLPWSNLVQNIFSTSNK